MLKYRIPQIVTLTLDKESFFEVYKLNEEMN